MSSIVMPTQVRMFYMYENTVRRALRAEPASQKNAENYYLATKTNYTYVNGFYTREM